MEDAAAARLGGLATLVPPLGSGRPPFQTRRLGLEVSCFPTGYAGAAVLRQLGSGPEGTLGTENASHLVLGGLWAIG